MVAREQIALLAKPFYLSKEGRGVVKRVTWMTRCRHPRGDAILILDVTKVQLEYPLVRPLGDADAQAIADVHGSYGILRVRPAPSLDQVTVEYDASRLSEKDLEAVLQRFGIPIRRQFSV